MITRNISRTTRNPFHQGFLGTGHSASAVLGGIPYEISDPFIVFMDDRLDLPGGEPVGGPHPHAGFETLTLVLEGNGENWETGSFELMTAGKGIIHTEEITSRQKLHILQVWLALPPEKRWIEPSWQKIKLEDTPIIRTEGYEIRVYSGSSNGLISPVKNHTPLTLVDFSLKPEQSVNQELPAEYSGLIYVLEGSVNIGAATVRAGEAGWLDSAKGNGNSQLIFRSTGENTRFVLYAARPHRVPITSYGPFIGDSMEDIGRLYKEYRNGKIPHLEDLDQSKKEIVTADPVK